MEVDRFLRSVIDDVAGIFEDLRKKSVKPAINGGEFISCKLQKKVYFASPLVTEAFSQSEDEQTPDTLPLCSDDDFEMVDSEEELGNNFLQGFKFFSAETKRDIELSDIFFGGMPKENMKEESTLLEKETDLNRSVENVYTIHGQDTEALDCPHKEFNASSEESGFHTQESDIRISESALKIEESKIQSEESSKQKLDSAANVYELNYRKSVTLMERSSMPSTESGKQIKEIEFQIEQTGMHDNESRKMPENCEIKADEAALTYEGSEGKIQRCKHQIEQSGMQTKESGKIINMDGPHIEQSGMQSKESGKIIDMDGRQKEAPVLIFNEEDLINRQKWHSEITRKKHEKSINFDIIELKEGLNKIDGKNEEIHESCKSISSTMRLEDQLVPDDGTKALPENSASIVVLSSLDPEPCPLTFPQSQESPHCDALATCVPICEPLRPDVTVSETSGTDDVDVTISETIGTDDVDVTISEASGTNDVDVTIQEHDFLSEEIVSPAFFEESVTEKYPIKPMVDMCVTKKPVVPVSRDIDQTDASVTKVALESSDDQNIEVFETKTFHPNEPGSPMVVSVSVVSQLDVPHTENAVPNKTCVTKQIQIAQNKQVTGEVNSVPVLRNSAEVTLSHAPPERSTSIFDAFVPNGTHEEPCSALKSGSMDMPYGSNICWIVPTTKSDGTVEAKEDCIGKNGNVKTGKLNEMVECDTKDASVPSREIFSESEREGSQRDDDANTGKLEFCDNDSQISKDGIYESCVAINRSHESGNIGDIAQEVPGKMDSEEEHIDGSGGFHVNVFLRENELSREMECGLKDRKYGSRSECDGFMSMKSLSLNGEGVCMGVEGKTLPDKQEDQRMRRSAEVIACDHDQSVEQTSPISDDTDDIKFYDDESSLSNDQIKQATSSLKLSNDGPDSDVMNSTSNVFSWPSKRKLFSDDTVESGQVKRTCLAQTNNQQTPTASSSATSRASDKPPQRVLRLGLSKRTHVKRLHAYLKTSVANIEKQVVPDIDATFLDNDVM